MRLGRTYSTNCIQFIYILISSPIYISHIIISHGIWCGIHHIIYDDVGYDGGCGEWQGLWRIILFCCYEVFIRNLRRLHHKTFFPFRDEKRCFPFQFWRSYDLQLHCRGVYTEWSWQAEFKGNRGPIWLVQERQKWETQEVLLRRRLEGFLIVLLSEGLEFPRVIVGRGRHSRVI